MKSQCKRMASSQESTISKTGSKSNHRYSNWRRSSRPPHNLRRIHGKTGEPTARKIPLHPKRLDEDCSLVNHTWTHFSRSNKIAGDKSQLLKRFWEINTTGLPVIMKMK